MLLIYAQKCLTEASSQKNQFRNELEESIKLMDDHERFEFYKWCRVKYYYLYPDVLEEAFQDIFRAVKFTA
ncbi:hypothetical protein OU798_14560 [Prolixibacteraceae bacterium Z1-6]|uniref:Uncharacterized protein n=1 Tax=Draconibacterium aestuarii TaxID=2998507 RepID=A0A9X3J8C2_9BACT|nr:hypothetical protein [Prolixibacteraceae bacterium Z1-6]